MSMRIGILTSGGDCSGLNSGIYEAYTRLEDAGHEPVLIPDGFAGLQRAENLVIDRDSLWMYAKQGGSVLGSSRTKLQDPEPLNHALKGSRELRLDGLVVFGGDGSLQGAARLVRAGLLTVGVPKTIDSDVGCTEETIGFYTAVQVGCESVERIDDSRRSHRSAFLVEVMGRRSGFLAASIARASGASGVLIPESPWSLNNLASRFAPLKGGLVVVSESAWSDDLGPARLAKNGKPIVGGVVEHIAKALTDIGVERVRTATLGHALRGGSPTAADRLLARDLTAVAISGIFRNESGVAVKKEGQCLLAPPEAAFEPRRFMSDKDINLLSGIVVPS